MVRIEYDFFFSAVLLLVNHAWDLEPFFLLILEIRLSAFTDTNIPKQLKKKKNLTIEICTEIG